MAAHLRVIEDNGEKLELSSEACDVLSELRTNGQLCDAILKVGDREFFVHRTVMSIKSPYFRALFTNDLSSADQREFVIPSVSADMMQMIIDFAYTRKTYITTTNVLKLLPVAHLLRVQELVNYGCDFLADNLEADGCMDTYKFAKQHSFISLVNACYKYIMTNFRRISTSSAGFVELTIDEICDILSSDDLNVKNEELVFSALIRWVNHAPEIRKSHIYQLLKTVRVGFLTTRYFAETIRPHPYVLDSSECQPLVLETLKFLCALDMDDYKELDLNNPLARPRIPHEVLFVVGGCTNGSLTNDVKAYDSRAEKWITCNHRDTEIHAYHGLVALGTKIYVIGGFGGFHYLNGVRCFDVVTKDWAEVAPMYSNRCYLCAVQLGDRIYAVGGYDGHDRLNTAESYLPSRNQWTLVAPMFDQRSDASATTLNGNMYIFGGFDGEDYLDTAEYYQPSNNQWTRIAPMRMRRTGLGVAALDGQIYVIGGFCGLTRLSSGERYDPATDTWHAFPEMFYIRSHFGFEVIDDMLFAFGGFDGINSISGVEYFDVKSQEWFDAKDMPRSREAFGTCIMKDIPNVNDYIYERKPIGSAKKKSAGK